MNRYIVLLALALFVSAGPAMGQAQNRVRYQGQDLFLSGGNVAWVDFARDIGPGSTRLDKFDQAFASVHASGGNTMRLWLHTTGAVTPEWSNGNVVGPGEGAIDDLRDILDLAWRHEVGLILCLWSFDMLRISNGTAITDRSYGLLTEEAKLQTYIDKALIPMVDSLKGHPGIIAWEIFNEPEGMSNEFGWNFNRHVPMANIQRFVNRTAGAIHRTDPNAKVTNGAWSFKALTDLDTPGSNNTNYYTDERLIAAGGDAQGTLDFYTVHYYEWAQEALSPFHNDYSVWGLTKPLVVAEFFLYDTTDGDANATFGVPYTDQYKVLYNRGYAGALAWQWVDWDTNRNPEKANWPRAIENMQTIWSQHRQDVDITPTFGLWYFRSSADSVAKGGQVELSWNVTDAASVTLNGQPVDSAGTKVVSLTETTTYTLAATGRKGGTDSRQLTVKVYHAGPSTRYELELASFTGDVTVQTNDATASGGKYLYMKDPGTITLSNVMVDAAGEYNLIIGYMLPFDRKYQYLDVNDVRVGEVAFEGQLNKWLTTSVKVNLKEGANKIAIVKSWGWMYFDYIAVEPATPVASEDEVHPGRDLLFESYPNPFRTGTTIGYELSAPGHVLLEVFDLAGRRVGVLVDELQGAGPHAVRFDGGGLPAGVYVFRIRVGEMVQSRRMVLVR